MGQLEVLVRGLKRRARCLEQIHEHLQRVGARLAYCDFFVFQKGHQILGLLGLPSIKKPKRRILDAAERNQVGELARSGDASGQKAGAHDKLVITQFLETLIQPWSLYKLQVDIVLFEVFLKLLGQDEIRRARLTGTQISGHHGKGFDVKNEAGNKKDCKRNQDQKISDDNAPALDLSWNVLFEKLNHLIQKCAVLILLA